MKKLLFFFLAYFCFSTIVQAQYSIGQLSTSFQDPARSNRNVGVEIYYPTQAGNIAPDSFPIIVFGHGFAMAYSAYANLKDEWVPRGYILVFPTTEPAVIPAPNHSNFAGDLVFLVQKMRSLHTSSSSIFYQHIRMNAAVAGHSMGGGCAVLGLSNTTVPIQAYIGMAPAETNPSAIAAAANVTIPSLILSGSSDQITAPNTNHRPIYDTINQSQKAFVSILNGSHCYFANTNFYCDFGESSPGSLTRATQQAVSNFLSNPWLDYYLKGDCVALDSFLARSQYDSRIQSQLGLAFQNFFPTITDSLGILSVAVTGTAYQWFNDGLAVSGATSQTYQPTLSGNYSVQVSYSNTCQRMSNEYAVSIQPPLANEHLNTVFLQVFPNPLRGEILHINCNFNFSASCIYQVFNTQGILCQEGRLTQNSINLGDLSSGCFQLRLVDKENALLVSTRFVK